jgi:hypothetical protein
MMILFLPAKLFAQVNISGQIKDLTDKPINMVEVLLQNKDSIVVKSQLTDTIGKFTMSAQPSDYILLVKQLGILLYTQNISASQNLALGVINIKVNKQQLKEVVVTSKKPLIERKVDRLVFNVENSITSIGADALEVIAKAPGVRVLNNKIVLVGKSSLTVMIDDRLLQLSGDDLSDFLKSISAETIAKIEVITNPPAKYDADGNSGLINIVLKKNKKSGYSGAATLGYKQTVYSKIFENTNFNYNKNKSTFYLNINGTKGSYKPIEETTIFYPTQTWIQTNSRRSYNADIFTQAGWDYQITKKTLLATSYYIGINNPDMVETIKTPIKNLVQDIDSTIITNASTNRNTRYQTANLHLAHQLDTLGKKITVDGNWFTYIDDNDREFANKNYFGNGQFIPNTSTQYLSKSNQNIKLYTLNAITDLPFKTFTVSFGGKLTFIQNQSDVNFYQLLNNSYDIDITKSNQFNYTENTQAVFANFNKTVNKWELQLGVRGENTLTNGFSITTNQNNTNNYFKIFPTAYLTYNANDKNTYSLTYGRRISRPSYWSLNPFKWYSNPYSYSEGNPFLQPSFTHNIELSYTYNSYITTAISYSKENYQYDQLTIVEPSSNIQVTKPYNFITGYFYQLSNSIQLNKINWLENNIQFQIYYTKSNSSLAQTLPTTNGLGAYVSTDNQILLNKQKTIIGNINYWYQFPAISGIDNVLASSNLDAGIKFLLYRKKLQLTINTSDLFRTNRPRFYSTINDIRINNNNYYDNRCFRFIVRYSFGNDKIKSKEREDLISNERNRAN